MAERKTNNYQSNYQLRTAIASDLDDISELLPRLADFELPDGREASDVWRGDEEMFQQWASGNRTDVEVMVAENDKQKLSGVVAISLRKDAISSTASSHLEVLVIRKSDEGQGLGARLIETAESRAQSLGATSMTLNVFAANSHARKLYEKSGFYSEVIRYNKWL